MLRIGTMNMILHGVEGANIGYRDSLSEGEAGHEEDFTVILANPPFKGSIDKSPTAKNLTRVVDTTKTELLFLALFIRQLKNGGRAAVIVPDGVLFGSSNAHKAVRKLLIEDHKLDAVVKLPSGVFKPYAGVSTAILFFTKTNSGGTDKVWFYDVQADGYSLDDKRDALLDIDKLGVNPKADLAEQDHTKNNLPDVLVRWQDREGSEADNSRTAQSFFVPKQELAENSYDLSLKRYQEIVHAEVNVRQPSEVLKDLKLIEKEINSSIGQLESQL
jgi:type I restriction enzyme M protein